MGTSQQQSSSSQTTKLSKRQKRALGSNPSTAWQQQPRIKSANARARAYINYANLADDQKKKKPTVEELLNPTLSLHSPEVKFGRLLGGTDQHARHGAVKMLREYLRARSDFTNGGQGLSELDLLKLWKVRLVVHTYTLPALVSFYIAVFSHQSSLFTF